MEVALRSRLIVITAVACGAFASLGTAAPEATAPPPAYGVDPTPAVPPETPTTPPESPPLTTPPAGPAKASDTRPPTRPARRSAVETRLGRQVRRLQRQLAGERRKHRRALAQQRRKMTTRLARVERMTVERSEIQHAFALAAATYGVSRDKLARVSHCESTHNPFAVNGRYLGLFQFGTSLWSQTPYGSFSRTDPHAAALAAAWAFARGMHSHWPECGRR